MDTSVLASPAVAQLVKAALVTAAALGLSALRWPTSTPVKDIDKASFDYIVVGAGTAGSIVANRLTENPDISVLVIEAGGEPPVESVIPSLFPLLPRTIYDWDYVAEDSKYPLTHYLTAGKMYGGTSSLHHFYYVRGHVNDYRAWADAVGDDSWTWERFLPYFKKSERLEDEEILNSPTGKYHGRNGYTGITRALDELALKYLEAYREVGRNIVQDINTGYTLGFTRPMMFIADGIRQSSAEAFLVPIKNRTNFYITKNTIVDKILIDEKKNAIGVQAFKNGKTFNIYARKEVIVSAGTFNSPKLLMLSGIGPKDHLKSKGIKAIADLPVGQNLIDHLATFIAYQLERTNEVPESRSPSQFSVPTFVGVDAVNRTQGYPDYLSMHLISRNNPLFLSILCTVVYNLNPDFCEQLVNVGTGREVLVTILNIARPLSRGKVLLRSANPRYDPKIYMRYLSNEEDLEDNVASIEHLIEVTNSSYFRSVGGKTINFDLPKCRHLKRNTREYWRCYVRNVMDTCYHYTSTCSMGSVLDAKLRVLGVNKLRVVDASAMPIMVSANINAAVMALAEKAADLIKEAFINDFDPCVS